MLKTIGCNDAGKTEIEFGDYLPFKFWQNLQSGESHLFWRTGDLKSTIIEVKIDRIRGQVLGVSLLLPGLISRDFPELDLSKVLESNGYPLIDISKWAMERIIDEPNSFRVFVDSNRLLITFSSSVAVTSTVVSDNIVFGVDVHNFIVWILVSGLKAEKLNEFSCSYA